ncbi:thioredoxin domain-containing protein [Chryseobacterium sp. LC2016-29]|uniref:thioredoxin domain-containing protein n=1 Tax=Chryseobacterium sp. LC2016-29 TaxID=2897331 RepID=UPI001E636B0B|nr:thioredoxin domain-containing protein [Chryseobacterium sp. LC2016-29]MCD0477766.1 thioredoxin domain-containing protein [Chryseobacterium sp. LC2016-29]
MYKKLITVFLVLVVQGVLIAQNKTEQKSLPAKEFYKKIETAKDAQLVDVRTPDEFLNGHLINAMNIDWKADDFEEKSKALDKNKPVYVYCMSGPRSTAASTKLQEMGFKKVYVMEGGMMKWRNADLPEIKKSNTAGMSLLQYNELLDSETLVLVDFYAEWCAPCRKMEPYLKKIGSELSDKVKVVRINADENTQLCKELNVSALPVLKLYKNNNVIWENLGFVEEAEVRKQILQ